MKKSHTSNIKAPPSVSNNPSVVLNSNVNRGESDTVDFVYKHKEKVVVKAKKEEKKEDVVDEKKVLCYICKSLLI